MGNHSKIKLGGMTIMRNSNHLITRETTETETIKRYRKVSSFLDNLSWKHYSVVHPTIEQTA